MLISLQSVIDYIEKISSKNKIVILDSCHSGGFSLDKTPEIMVNESVEKFSGCGYAVLASCGENQVSGFNEARVMSTYTSFVCDALMCPYIIRKGKKSLEDINKAIYLYAKKWNRNNPARIQTPIFRENVGGTIFFNVEEYEPYKIKDIYMENSRYIIYSVKPLHHAQVKRLAVQVILRYPYTDEEIAAVAMEIKDQVLYAEVYQNEQSELFYKGKPANIIWCYFGFDEDDMIDPNYVCYTTWVDETQDKNYWYRVRKNTYIVNEICIQENTSYEVVKKLMHEERINDKDFIDNTRKIMSKLINIGETYLKKYREYINDVFSEDEFIKEISPYNNQIQELYLELTDLPTAPRKLHQWFLLNEKIAGDICDYSLFYNNKYLDKWNTENRMFLMEEAVKRYKNDLEELRELEQNCEVTL